VSDFPARRGIHGNHFGRSPGADKQARSRVVKGGVTWVLAANWPSRNYLLLAGVDYLKLIRDGNENKKFRSRLV
jgi:hypothetical protein